MKHASFNFIFLLVPISFFSIFFYFFKIQLGMHSGTSLVQPSIMRPSVSTSDLISPVDEITK